MRKQKRKKNNNAWRPLGASVQQRCGVKKKKLTEKQNQFHLHIFL